MYNKFESIGKVILLSSSPPKFPLDLSRTTSSLNPLHQIKQSSLLLPPPLSSPPLPPDIESDQLVRVKPSDLPAHVKMLHEEDGYAAEEEYDVSW